MKKRIAVIGGGAAGITAALRIAESSEYEAVIFEKNDRIGKKLLRTGNGRCNISNTEACAESYESEIAKYPLMNAGVKKTKEFLTRQGLFLRSDTAGRIYPYSESAADVLNVFLDALKKHKVTVLTEKNVSAVKYDRDSGFKILSNEESCADAVIFCTGSKAAVKDCNTVDVLKKFGINCRPFKPALCPLPSDEKILKSLKGVRLKAKVTLHGREEYGEVQFNEKNISGICVFNLAKYARNGDTVSIDLMPEHSADNVFKALKKRRDSAYENSELTDGLFIKKVGLTLLKRAQIKPSERAALCPDEKLRNLSRIIKCFTVKVNAPTDFLKAQVASGGVPPEEIYPETLESRCRKGFFICGEALDVDGPCGGFNLQWALSSALTAADAAINYLNDEG